MAPQIIVIPQNLLQQSPTQSQSLLRISPQPKQFRVIASSPSSTVSSVRTVMTSPVSRPVATVVGCKRPAPSLSPEFDIKDIKETYNAKNHPDVKKGKKTEEEVLAEFLDTFEIHHAMKHPEDRDGKVTLKEFIEYYTNISSTIDNDQYFELMITNAWNLNNVSYGKAWAGEL